MEDARADQEDTVVHPDHHTSLAYKQYGTTVAGLLTTVVSGHAFMDHKVEKMLSGTRNAWHRCSYLLVLGVLMSTFLLGTALLLTASPYVWNWKTSLLLGGLLSATDPVAVRLLRENP